jgi:hypothetical protein
VVRGSDYPHEPGKAQAIASDPTFGRQRLTLAAGGTYAGGCRRVATGRKHAASAILRLAKRTKVSKFRCV